MLSEGRTGLFGRLREEARVKARVRPSTPRPKRNRRSRGRRGAGGPTRSAPANGRAREEDARRASVGPEQGTGSVTGGGRRRHRSRRGRPSGGAAEAVESSQRTATADTADARGATTAEEERGVAREIPLEEQGAVAREFVEGLLGAFGFEGTVEAREVNEDTVEVAANGDGLGVLIGPRGATLTALQEVTRTAVQRRFPVRTDRVLVDVAGYRQRRVAALRRFTTQVAEEVKGSREERALEPMSPADRKVVHDTVNELEGVATRSEGEEPARYVVIVPS